MKNLRAIFESLDGNLVQKWDHYIEIYDRYFNKYRNKEVHILEIGVSQGGSLEMWKSYFGSKARIYGVDINPRCKNLEDEQVSIFIGQQEDRLFWQELKKRVPKLDILIDDGGHTMQQQIVTFEEMFDHVKSEGVYLCEDTHTSYMYEYFGGYKAKGTFIEYAKHFIDFIHGHPSKGDKKMPVKKIYDGVSGVHFYRSMVVIEKNTVEPMKEVIKGRPTVGHVHPIGMQKTTMMRKMQKRIKAISMRLFK